MLNNTCSRSKRSREGESVGEPIERRGETEERAGARAQGEAEVRAECQRLRQRRRARHAQQPLLPGRE